jgi:lipopolysaccharide biosynthesis protein
MLDFRKFLCKGEEATSNRPKTCAVHIHGYYLDELWAIFDTLHDKIENFDLIVTTHNLQQQEAIIANLKTHPVGKSSGKWSVVQTPDRGRNIGPLLIDIFDELAKYDYALHMHTKRSVHCNVIEAWKDGLHQNLAGSKELINDIRRAFETNQELGILIPQPCKEMRRWNNWGRNFSLAKIILREVFEDVELHIDAPLVFPMGMMFWFRPNALAKLSEACRKLQPLPLEPLPLDGSPLHAIERLVTHCCEASGYRWQMICTEMQVDGRQHEDHQTSVIKPLTNTYIQASSILGVEMRRLMEVIEKSRQKHETELRLIQEELIHVQNKLCLSEDKLLRANHELNAREQKLLIASDELTRWEQENMKAEHQLQKATSELTVLQDEMQVQRNRLSARIASWLKWN